MSEDWTVTDDFGVIDREHPYSVWVNERGITLYMQGPIVPLSERQQGDDIS